MNLFAPWAKAHPVAATELQRRQAMHDAWVSRYPDANNALRADAQSTMQWAQSHPAQEAEIQQFRQQCAQRLGR